MSFFQKWIIGLFFKHKEQSTCICCLQFAVAHAAHQVQCLKNGCNPDGGLVARQFLAGFCWVRVPSTPCESKLVTLYKLTYILLKSLRLLELTRITKYLYLFTRVLQTVAPIVTGGESRSTYFSLSPFVFCIYTPVWSISRRKQLAVAR